MEFGLTLFGGGLIEKQAVNEIMKNNDLSVKYGLVLTESQAKELVETRSHALKTSGRIEFGGGVIDKLIYEFCDSPYVDRNCYAETLNELVEIFYFYKNETLDRISDDELISFMKKAFDGVCQGSLELLSGRELYRLAHNIRFGYPLEYNENEEGEDDE